MIFLLIQNLSCERVYRLNLLDTYIIIPKPTPDIACSQFTRFFCYLDNHAQTHPVISYSLPQSREILSRFRSRRYLPLTSLASILNPGWTSQSRQTCSGVTDKRRMRAPQIVVALTRWYPKRANGILGTSLASQRVTRVQMKLVLSTTPGCFTCLNVHARSHSSVETHGEKNCRREMTIMFYFRVGERGLSPGSIMTLGKV
jgi:hypothetical protein